MKIEDRFFFIHDHTVEFLKNMIFYVFQMTRQDILDLTKIAGFQTLKYLLVLMKRSFHNAGQNQITAVFKKQKIKQFL